MSMTETIYSSLLSYPWDKVNSHHLNRYIQFINAILTKRPENVKFEYSERHHILPKSMGGSNNKENLIYLSYREHYLAHYMLAKAFPNHNIVFALFYMMNKSNNRNSHLYENAKNLIHNMKYKRIIMNNGIIEKYVYITEIDTYAQNGFIQGRLPFSDESKIKMSKSQKAKYTEDNNYINPMTGRKHSEQMKTTLSKSRTGIGNPSYGKKWLNNGYENVYVYPEQISQYILLGYVEGKLSHTNETKNKIKQSYIGRKWMNNGYENRFVIPEEIDNFLLNGYTFGKQLKKNLKTK